MNALLLFAIIIIGIIVYLILFKQLPFFPPIPPVTPTPQPISPTPTRPISPTPTPPISPTPILPTRPISPTQPGTVIKYATIKINMRSRFPLTAAARKPLAALPSAPTLPLDFVLPSPYLPTPCLCEHDPVAAEKLVQLRAPVKLFNQWINTLNDAIVWDSNAGAQDALLAGLDREFKRGAFMGTLNTQGELERMLWSIVISAIAMRSDKPVSSTIKAWIQKVINETQAEFLPRKGNLKIWCILSMTIAGLALGNTSLIETASSSWDDVCKNLIIDSGEMPGETERGSRAPQYHEYSCNPLVTSGFWLRKDNPRLHALVNYVLALDRTLLPKYLPWMALYNTQFGFGKLKNKAQAQKELDLLLNNPMTVCSLGGNVYWQIS